MSEYNHCRKCNVVVRKPDVFCRKCWLEHVGNDLHVAYKMYKKIRKDKGYE